MTDTAKARDCAEDIFPDGFDGWPRETLIAIRESAAEHIGRVLQTETAALREEVERLRSVVLNMMFRPYYLGGGPGKCLVCQYHWDSRNARKHNPDSAVCQAAEAALREGQKGSE